MKTTVLTLKWNHDTGEAEINFAGLDKLYGVEKMDFLSDCIAMLQEKEEEVVPSCLEIYKKVDNT